MKTIDDAAVLRELVAADGWVLDVDGCLVRTTRAGGAGGSAFEGAVELLDWLARHDKPYIVCTNASQRTVPEYAAHLRSLGLAIDDAQLITAASAAAEYVAAHYPGVPVLAVGDAGLEQELRARGIALADPVRPPAGQPPGVVVVGAADHYTSAAINAACLAIADHGAAFMTSVDAPWFHGGVGRSVASSTAIAAAIATVTGKPPTIYGKPSHAIGEVLRAHLGGEGRRLVVVGDMASIEIQLAHRMGAIGVLVMSGGTSAAEIAGLPPEHRPHLRVQDVGELVRRIESVTPPGDRS